MKQILLSSAFILSALSMNAQTDLNLKLNHYWNGDVFNYGQYYEDPQGRVIEITRVQYYLTGFDLVHDGGQNTSLGDEVVLASGNITDYSIGNEDITNLEGMNFDLGVDQARNHLDPNTYPPGHPLALSNPSMHWGWSAGYRFLVIEGKVDKNDDQIPEAGFQFHVTGDDNYLTSVMQFDITGSASSGAIDINVFVNIADWVADIDLGTAGYNHGVYPINGQLMSNTNTFTVFTADIGLGIEKDHNTSSNVYFDYSMPYAPTIFYKFPTLESIDLMITDLNGREILSAIDLPNADNYFIEMELAAGTYIAVFKTKQEAIRTEKFVVRK